MRLYTLSVILLVVFIGLFFTITNKVYLSALPSVYFLILFLPFALMSGKSHTNSITWYTLLFFIVSLFNVIFYQPQALAEFSFYRYDGNFIISYAPFLFLPFICHTLDLDRILRAFLFAAVIVNIPAFLYFFMIGEPYYRVLYSATNAAGGFYAIICAMFLALIFHSRSVIHIIMLVFMIVLLIATSSRGSMLGFLAGIFVWWSWKKGYSKIVLPVIIIIVFAQALLLANFYDYYVSDSSLLQVMKDQHGRAVETKAANILIRLSQEWPRGFDAFTRSPILGYGFGSINDLPFVDKGILPGLVEFNNPVTPVYNSAHAHHSYLHILGEQGLLGFLVVLLMWASIHKFLINTYAIPWIRDGLIISFWTIIFASFTEHRLTTPAMILPFALMFLLYYGWCCNKHYFISSRSKLDAIGTPDNKQ